MGLDIAEERNVNRPVPVTVPLNRRKICRRSRRKKRKDADDEWALLLMNFVHSVSLFETSAGSKRGEVLQRACHFMLERVFTSSEWKESAPVTGVGVCKHA